MNRQKRISFIKHFKRFSFKFISFTWIDRTHLHIDWRIGKLFRAIFSLGSHLRLYSQLNLSFLFGLTLWNGISLLLAITSIGLNVYRLDSIEKAKNYCLQLSLPMICDSLFSFHIASVSVFNGIDFMGCQSTLRMIRSISRFYWGDIFVDIRTFVQLITSFLCVAS